jgi:hypothetical protein
MARILTYRLVRHNLAEIQDIREEASLIFRMKGREGHWAS